MGFIENKILEIERDVRMLKNRTNSVVTGAVRMQNDGGESEYKGAFVAGSVTWNTATGQPTNGTGGLFNEAGLFGVKSGVKTVELNFVTGDAFFKGDITGASGKFSGSLEVGIDAFKVDIDGNVWWGNSPNYAGATIKISKTGVVNFTSGNFKGDITGSSGNFSGDITGASGSFSGKIVAGAMSIGNDVNGTNDGIYIDSNDYWYSNGNFSMGNGAIVWDGSELNVTGKIFSQVSGRRIGLEGDKINLYDAGGVANGYLHMNSVNILTLFSNRRINIESTGAGNDVTLKAGDALRFYYNGGGTTSDVEYYSDGDRRVKINQNGLINTEGGFAMRVSGIDYNGVSGTFVDNNGRVVRVRGGIITNLDE